MTSCSSCIDTFKEAASERVSAKDRVNFVDGKYPKAVCETCSVSEHGIPRVDDNEILVRASYSPFHAPKGELDPGAFFSDCFTLGGSCDRLTISDFDEVYRRSEGKAEGKRRNGKNHFLRSFVKLDVSKIRKILFSCSGNRALAVYNTSLASNCVHAEIFVVPSNATASQLKGSHRAEIRNELHNAVIEEIAVEDVLLKKIIYRVLGSDEWAEALSHGEYLGAPDDVADGFIHFSTHDTLAATLALHYAGRDHLKLLHVPVAPIAQNIKWEPARGGTLFPHLYARLSVQDVFRVDDVRLDENGVHILPEDLR